MSFRTLSTLLLLSLHSREILSSTVTLSVPASTPSDASSPVDPSFPGFAFEEASFYNFALDGQGNQNAFSQDLITNVLNRTGGTPILRVGGTSGDASTYNPAQSSALNKPATSTGPLTAGGLSVGPSFFKAFSSFPEAEFILMVPLMNKNLSSGVEWTQQAVKYIGNRLQAVELGNEPDLYGWYNLDAYVSEYNNFVTTLSSQVSQLKGKVIFQALDTSWGSKSTLNVPDALSAGLNKTKQVRQVAHHYYQGGDEEDGLAGLQRRIANHTAISSGVASFKYGINYLKSNLPRVPYILSENGNTLGNNDPTQRNNLATALWNVDFQLYSMSINVWRVNMQQILQPGYGMWEPVQSSWGPPLVRANYYSQPFVADFIGLHQSPNVVEIPIAGTDTLAAYVAYVNGKPVRIAIINFDLWNGSGTRPAQNFVIKSLPSSYTSGKIHTLTAPTGAYANSTLTWGGSSWSYNAGRAQVAVQNDAQTSQISNGALTVSVKATSAIIVNLS